MSLKVDLYTSTEHQHIMMTMLNYFKENEEFLSIKKKTGIQILENLLGPRSQPLAAVRGLIFVLDFF